MKTHPSKKGFSLLELLTVMAIIAMLSTVAVTGYFSAARGIAKQRGITGLMNALTLARQRACTEGVKTTLICYNTWSGAETEGGASKSEKRKACTPTYVICKAIGQFTSVEGNYLGDEFTPLDRLFNFTTKALDTSAPAPIRLYNMTRPGGWSDVQMDVRRKAYSDILQNPETPWMPATSPAVLLCFYQKKTGGDNWQVGDSYGVVVSPVASLPKGVYFGNTLDPSSGSSTTPPTIVFNFYPDGRADRQSIELKMLESSGDSGLARVKRISVSEDGIVSSSN